MLRKHHITNLIYLYVISQCNDKESIKNDIFHRFSTFTVMYKWTCSNRILGNYDLPSEPIHRPMVAALSQTTEWATKSSLGPQHSVNTEINTVVIEDNQRWGRGEKWWQHDFWLTVQTHYTIYILTPGRISQGHMQNGRQATFSWPTLYLQLS
jgi:hypothetical protein